MPKGAEIPDNPSSITPTVVTDQTTWNAGWYVVSGDVTISKRITVNGDVNLILADDCKLDAKEGITVASDDNSLTIYGCEKGTGKLIATSNHNQNAAIGGASGDAGKITINGGVVTAANEAGSSGAAAIGGGDDASGGVITINGGIVTAMNNQRDSTGAAIGSGQSNIKTVSGGVIKINGGKVTARALNGAAIGGGAPETAPSDKITGGTITINGGIIEATSTNGDGIGCGSGVSSTGTNRGTLSSETDGTAWIVASSIEAKSDGFNSGVIFDTKNNNGNGEVYGDMIISEETDELTVPDGKKLTVVNSSSLAILADKKLTLKQGSILEIEDGGKLTIEGATEEKEESVSAILDAANGKIINNGIIINNGEVALVEETEGAETAEGEIENHEIFENNGLVNMSAKTTADDIKVLNLSGNGKVMAGEKEYSNDGKQIGGGGDSSQPQAGAGASTINLGPAGGSIDQILASVGVVRSENIRSASDFTDAFLNDSEDSLDTTTGKTDENQQIDATEQALKETQTEQGSSTGQATGTEQENAPKTRFERVTHRLFGYTVKHPSELTFMQRILLALYFFW